MHEEEPVGGQKVAALSLIRSQRERTLDQFLATANSNKLRGTRRRYFSATSATHRGTLTRPAASSSSSSSSITTITDTKTATRSTL